jgi:hypothetical protein
MTVPSTNIAGSPEVSWNVVALSEARFIGMLNVAEALLLSGTPVEPPLGVFDSTVGGIAAGASGAASRMPVPASRAVIGSGSDSHAPTIEARISENETIESWWSEAEVRARGDSKFMVVIFRRREVASTIRQRSATCGSVVHEARPTSDRRCTAISSDHACQCAAYRCV